MLPNQQAYSTVDNSVLSAVLAAVNQTKASNGDSVNGLATQTTRLLERLRTDELAKVGDSAGTQTTTQTPQNSMALAISKMKRIVAALCSSCSFSDADYQEWVRDRKPLPSENGNNSAKP